MTILTGSKAFGFRGARLKLHGVIYEETDSGDGATWQLRIPLIDSQYVNFIATWSRACIRW